jgi:thymidine kinase
VVRKENKRKRSRKKVINKKIISDTGIKELNNIFSPGIYDSLYVFWGDEYGSGVSTMLHQLSDELCSTGRDVLLFSPLHSKRDIIAESLQRLGAKYYNTAVNDEEKLPTVKRTLTEKIENEPLFLEIVSEHETTIADQLTVINTPLSNTSIETHVAQHLKNKNDDVAPVIIIDNFETCEALSNSTCSWVRKIANDHNTSVIVGFTDITTEGFVGLKNAANVTVKIIKYKDVKEKIVETKKVDEGTEFAMVEINKRAYYNITLKTEKDDKYNVHVVTSDGSGYVDHLFFDQNFLKFSSPKVSLPEKFDRRVFEGWEL